MSTRPGEHQGLGLTHYLWASSPLRRYSDLVNQRQLLAAIAGERPPYAENDAELFAALADFEATYSQYAEFQDRMEHYWCLRWLLQERVTETSATVMRENLVRFDRLPLTMRLPDLPTSPPETQVRVAIVAIDLLNATHRMPRGGRKLTASSSPHSRLNRTTPASAHPHAVEPAMGPDDRSSARRCAWSACA